MRPARLRARLALAAAAAIGLAGCGGGSARPATGPTLASDAPVRLPTGLPGLRATPPPWDNGASVGLAARLKAIGLPRLTAEGTVLHIHQHLDVFVGGRPTVIPGGIGIDPLARWISPVHTHDGTGVIHVESPVERQFTLGQFFAVWGARLTRTCLGSLCAHGAQRLQVWANGRPVTGDPTRLVLTRHEEIVVAFGTAAQAPRPVPARYAFAPGL